MPRIISDSKNKSIINDFTAAFTNFSSTGHVVVIGQTEYHPSPSHYFLHTRSSTTYVAHVRKGVLPLSALWLFSSLLSRQNAVGSSRAGWGLVFFGTNPLRKKISIFEIFKKKGTYNFPSNDSSINLWLVYSNIDTI